MIIYGDIVSKANQYQIITINGHASLKKSKAVKAYENAFFLQNPLRDINISEPFKLDVDVFFSSNRKDLDGAFKLLLDILQSSKTIKNDRYCVEIHARKFIDKTNPRIESTITPVQV